MSPSLFPYTLMLGIHSSWKIQVGQATLILYSPFSVCSSFCSPIFVVMNAFLASFCRSHFLMLKSSLNLHLILLPSSPLPAWHYSAVNVMNNVTKNCYKAPAVQKSFFEVTTPSPSFALSFLTLLFVLQILILNY